MPGEISIGSATCADIVGTTTPSQAIEDIRTGKWGFEIAAVRAATGDERDRLKKNLPGLLWSGTFTRRANAGLIQNSGLICADIDKVNERIAGLHDLARNDPHALAAFVSPTGTGLKIVFRATEFSAVRNHVSGHYNAEVDESAKDVARLCFVSHDPAAFYNPDAVELADSTSSDRLPKFERPAEVKTQLSRAQIAEKLLGKIRWAHETTGFCKCPGEHLHTTTNSENDCRVKIDGAPTIKCFHASCAGIVAGVNHELRSQIAKADFVPPASSLHRAGIAGEYLMDQPKPAQDGLPALIDFADFVAIPHETPPELVSGLLHQGSKLVLGSGSKSFKTWVLLDMALSVAHGLPFLGMATTRAKVLYINFEIQDFSWHQRIEAVAKAKGLTIERGQIVGLNLRGHAADFAILLPKIIAATKGSGFALIILDPIYKLYGGADENSTGDMALLMNGMESVAVLTGAAIAFGAHFAKGNASVKEPIDRISGSGVFGRDPDSILLFTRHEENEAFTIETVLRNSPPLPSFVVRWQFPLMRPDDGLDPSKLKQVVGRKKGHDPKKLLAIIAHTTPQNTISISQWALDGKVKRPTLNGYLADMRRQNWIKTVGEGTSAKQHITNEGRAFLNANTPDGN